MPAHENVPRISKADEALAYDAAQCVVETHRRVADFLRPGLTLGAIDKFVAKTLDDLDCRSCFLGYKVARHPPFTSHACLSVNDCVVHGTAGSYTAPMKIGDLLKVDIGVFHKGFVGDAGWTYSFGEPAPATRRLMDAGKQALARGISRLKPGKPYRDWAIEVESTVEREFGFKCILNWGGHGYGRSLHSPPHLSNHMPKRLDSWTEANWLWQPGNLMAVEPMLALTTGETYQKPLGRLTDWPVYTKDGSLAAHYEHDVLITENGPRVLTEGLEHLRDVVPV